MAKSLQDSASSSDRAVETYAGASGTDNKEQAQHGMGEVVLHSEEAPLFFNTVLPRCRHDSSHVVPPRNLKKHEVRVPIFDCV